MQIVVTLPDNPHLIVADVRLNQLAQIFASTTASYKFFWFSALLELHCRSCIKRRQNSLTPADAVQLKVLQDVGTASLRSPSIEQLRQSLLAGSAADADDGERLYFWKLAAMMVAKAWYPKQFFHLRYGSSDQTAAVIDYLCGPGKELDPALSALKPDLNEDEVFTILCTAAARCPAVKHKLLELTRYVPYRLLSPWIKYLSDPKTIKESAANPLCLYQIKEASGSGDLYLEVHAVWQDYLLENRGVLQNFTDLALVQYLEKRNPNVPNLVSKLRRPDQRSSLTKAKVYFNAYLAKAPDFVSIYSGRPIGGNYALDHFIPWSFVAHNEIWNLVPIDQSSNSSKSDKLPNPDIYLPRLAQVQRAALHCNIEKLEAAAEKKKRPDLFSHEGDKSAFLKARDSLTAGLGQEIDKLYAMSADEFAACLHRAIYPLYLQALSLNFEPWHPEKGGLPAS